MSSAPRRLLALALGVLLLWPASAFAQAFTPPPQVGSVTLSWQWVENTGHILSDGTLFPRGQSVTTSLLAEVDYGVSERFAATVSIPFVFAKYTGGLPPRSGLDLDACKCWNESFQDFSIAGRYRFGDEFWAITPSARLIIPSHNYTYLGEAVVGPNLNQVLLGISGAWRLVALPKASIQAGYTYAITEETEGIRPNRSNLAASVGYAITRSLFVHGGALFQKNHGGLTVNELLTGAAPPDQAAQADRLLKMRWVHMTGGVSYSTNFADIFVGIEPYVWGRDTHDGIAFTVGSTWYFDFSRSTP